MEVLKVDRTKLITKTEYARERGISPAAVDKMVKTQRVKTVKIKGAELIYKD
jgi:DNA-binding Xre family transcriptional regulator